MRKESHCCHAPLVKFPSGGSDKIDGPYCVCHHCKTHYKIDYYTDEVFYESPDQVASGSELKSND